MSFFDSACHVSRQMMNLLNVRSFKMAPSIWRNVKRRTKAKFEESLAEVMLENTLYNIGYFLDPRVNHGQKQAYS